MKLNTSDFSLNKKIFIPFIIIGTILFGLEIYLYHQINSTESVDEDIVMAMQEIEEMNKVTAEEAQDKISLIKQRLALKGLINKGDIHLDNKDYTLALAKYLQIHKKIPKDDSITKKIGDSYFYLKKYPHAYKYYKKIKDPVYIDEKMIAHSLIYSKSITKENLEYIQGELAKRNLNEEQKFYFENSFLCASDFSLCKKNFSEYFSENTSTGALSDLQNINEALSNYENFQIDDLSFKNALISGAFFENGLFPIAIKTGEEILRDKPDYRPVIKIVAKSYFELGNYLQAKKFLISFNELGDQDPEISFFLGIVYEKLHNYVLSSIHLKKALERGYEKSLNIRRRLIYNYYQMGETDKMLRIFQAIIENNLEEIAAKDLSLAIFQHIMADKIEEAKKFTQIGLERYPQEEIFLGYNGWIFLQEKEVSGALEKAKENLQRGLKINPNNPMLNLISGKLELELGAEKRAKLFFTKAFNLDEKGDFGKIAKEELDKLTTQTGALNKTK